MSASNKAPKPQSSPIIPFLSQNDPKISSSSSATLRSDNVKVNSSFQGHYHRLGLSCLVIHKFQGIPIQFPKSVSALLDALVAQGLMPSLSRIISEHHFVFWELEPFVFAVGKGESFTKLGFRQSDCPTVLPTGSKNSNSLKFPMLLSDSSKGLEWLRLALDMAMRNSPQSNRQLSTVDSLIASSLSLDQRTVSSQESEDPHSSQDSELTINSAPQSHSDPVETSEGPPWFPRPCPPQNTV